MLLASSYLILVFFTTSSLHAQSDLTLQSTVLGTAEVSAPGSVTLGPGFEAVSGSNFHAFIGPLQGPNSSTTVTSPSGSTTPTTTSTALNYIKTTTYREPELSIPSPTTAFKHIETIGYFDGLGRPMQTVSVGTSPSGNDVIQPMVYDDYGRESIKLLPYLDTKSDGSFRSGITMQNLALVNDYYNNGTLVGKVPDNRAYTQIGFDNSPLNRIVSQTGSGSHWSSKPVQINYLINTSSKPGWSVDDAGTFTAFSYPANSLYVTETIDEQGNKTREYKDKQGQIVLKESLLPGVDWLRTAYIYDDFGLLRCVVPPEAIGPEYTRACYYYKYDARNRMIEKIIPPVASPIKMAYDDRDRLRCTQNGNQSANNEWSFIKYDELNRPVETGTVICTTDIKAAISAASLNENRNTASTNYGYSNSTFPTSGATVLTVTWYDDYNFMSISDLGISDSLRSAGYDATPYDFTANTVAAPKGRVTGTMTKVLSASSEVGVVPKNILFATTYYDKYGHVLRTISDNHLGGKDVTNILYEDITYQVTQSKQEHFKGVEHIIIEKAFEYDHTGRLLATRQAVNGQSEVTLNAMKYNEIGEMTTKYLHSNSGLTTDPRSFIQKVDYGYNIRGWLTQINDPTLASDNDLFGMSLFYEDATGMGSLASGGGLYNGNIVGMKWNSKNDKTRGYRFSYDALNRLLNANYADGTSLNANTGYFNESVLSYDKIGNIKRLQRKHNNILVDDLTYNYVSGTSLIRYIDDAGTASSDVDDYPGTSSTYGYDNNGNMWLDGSRNMSISYINTLNLPQSLDFGNNNRIFYHYTATGAKLIKHVRPGSGTESYTHYIGNIVYDGGTLSYIITDEGRLIPHGTGSNRTFVYEYNLKDHLGNNRVTFMGTDLGGAVDVVQTSSYYPFGLVMNQFNGNTAPGYQKNKYLYNGKELQDDNLNGTFFGMLDYGARFYDPQIGRWHVIDNKAEKYYSVSQYIYALNNPIKFLDPDGNDVVYFDEKGSETSRVQSNTEFRTYVQTGSLSISVFNVGVTVPTYSEATMPGVVDGYEDPKYQKLDYQIAASTFIMNDKLDSKTDLPTTDNHQFTENSKTPQIDVNLVKSMVMEESKMGTNTGPNGTGKSDPMQVNNKGDFDSGKDVKEAVGLSKGQKMNPQTSINAGLGVLVLKGMNSDKKGNYTTWKGDKTAVGKYNGGGNPNYVKEVYNIFNSINPATPANYVTQ